MITKKTTGKTKFIPLKKIYYGKYCYKIIVFQPYHPTYSKSYFGKTISTQVNKQRVALYNEFQKLKKKLVPNMDKNTTMPLIMNQNSWGSVYSQEYNERVLLYFDNKDIFDKFYQTLKDWVLVVEQPINDSHLSVYKNDLDMQVLIKPNLFKYNFRYRAPIPCTISNDKNYELYNIIQEAFSGRDQESFYCRLNYYSITVLTNDINDLLLLQLIVNKKIKFEKIVKPEEITE